MKITKINNSSVTERSSDYHFTSPKFTTSNPTFLLSEISKSS